MSAKKMEITDDIFDNLLYLSRLSVKEKERALLKEQVSVMADYFNVLQEFSDARLDVKLFKAQTEDDLQEAAIKDSITQRDLRRMSDEYMDGYFRVPKVIDNE